MSNYDIVFGNNKLYDNYNIVFNDSTAPLVPPVYGSGLIPANLPKVRASGTNIRYIYVANISLKASNIKLAILSYYNVNNPFEWLKKNSGSLQEATIAINKSSHNFRNSLSNFNKITTTFEKADYLETFFYTKMEGGLTLGNKLGSNFEKAGVFDSLIINSSLESAVTFSVSRNQSLQRAELLNSNIYKTSLQNGETVYTLFNTDYQKSLPVERCWYSAYDLSSIAVHNFIGKFEKAEELGNPKPSIIILPPKPVVDYNADILFMCLAKEWELDPYKYRIVFNDTCELIADQPTDYSEPIFVKNTFTLKNLETGQEIKATDLSFSTDVDSYAWTGSMTIPDNQVAFLKSPTNKAVLIEYIFNDIKAVFQVGKVSRNITFGQRSYKVKLSSPTIKFDEPISGIDSYTNRDTLTPNAYAEKLIDPTNNGINLIWDFLPPLEWVINKGAFTYQNLSPIKAIGSMLENSGAFISSSLDGKNLIVKRKRPIVFWEEIDSSKIINIPTGVITSLGYEIEHLQHFNGVYVLADDRTVFVRRRETNGATLAPQVVAKQLTSNQACVEAGRYVLANAGIVETHDLAKPILNDGVLLNPADVIKFVLDGVTYIGTVISTNVAIKFNSQYQTFKVEVIKGFN